MEGLYTHLGRQHARSSGLSLLGMQGNLEIMTQRVTRGAAVWLTPADSSDTIEFFFIHEGGLDVMNGDQVEIHLEPGDSFHIIGLKKDVLLRCTEDTLLLYISNCPIFDNEAYWQEELQELLRRIDSQDHTTRFHSYGVMQYASELYKALADHCKLLTLEEFVVGAVFHDVGKSNVPGHILHKKDRLTAEEYKLIQQHPIDSANILEPRYGARIAQLARLHHERLDGSGYPQGLCGDEIPFEARILAVADAFDAMTRGRGYNQVKTFEEAVEELKQMPNAHDPLVVNTLARLVADGTIAPGITPQIKD